MNLFNFETRLVLVEWFIIRQVNHNGYQSQPFQNMSSIPLSDMEEILEINAEPAQVVQRQSTLRFRAYGFGLERLEWISRARVDQNRKENTIL